MGDTHRLKLACQSGHFTMAEPLLRSREDGSYGMIVPCDYGDHWLAPDAEDPERLAFRAEPFGWSTAYEALAAADRYVLMVRERFF